ncbi:TrlF family AAA-like ATPase [Candidatus Poriferisodalis sp.]|uniref:TrlF family AAA-like ATPase n=1 Tax=Candidatus Poriferisodalis sp. TaxID=3101277 RepID=UPI003D0DA08C
MAMTKSEPDVVADALRLPSGAHFVRCALQVNPHNYSGTHRGQASEGNPADYASALIAKAKELGIGVLAITDHNSVAEVPTVHDAAVGSGIVVLPGFELESAEGIHVLCIYPASTEMEKLGRYLGEFGIRDPRPSSRPSTKHFELLLQAVHAQGGVAIAAHVSGRKGLFQALEGQARVAAWRNEHLLAVQIPGRVDDLPGDFPRIVCNKNVEYARERPAGRALAVAVVNAKDIVQPDDLENPAATCWIKMSDPWDVEGLRQAFLDPDSRIRLHSDGQPEEHSELLALAWQGGGFLDGGAIHFNPNLNVLIGGRGTGKSTAIESIRYVLGLEPVGDEARNAHQEIVRHVLRNGTKVSLEVRSLNPSERIYRIERTVPNPPIIRDTSGQVSKLRPADVLPRVEVYGQHEISELTRSREKLTQLLHRFVRADADISQRKASVLRGLRKARESIVETTGELAQIDENLAALPQLEETLVRFQEAGLEERLRDQSLLVREAQIVDSIPERLGSFRNVLATLRQELPVDQAFVSQRALADLPGGPILHDVNQVLEELNSALETAARQLEEALVQAEQHIDAITSRWFDHKAEIDAQYQSILRELQKSAVDGEEFIRLRRNIESLRPLEERRNVLVRLQANQRQQRRDLLAEWEDLKAVQFRELDGAAKQVNSQLKGLVQVKVTAAGDRAPLFELLRNEIGGRLAEALERLEVTPQLSLRELADRCREGATTLAREYGLKGAQAENLASAAEGTLMKIEELELPSTTDLLLNTASGAIEPSWHGLDQLSKGQKATAVLLLLLLESDAPLIIDQPEDDLDNRFISEVVVERMRDNKRRRQFVFSTHNANIPVLGDAELILGLDALGEAEGGKAFIASQRMGSIDTPAVRILVEEVLEGGKDAFEKRRRKYGF